MPALVYGLAIVTSIVSTAFRPAEASLIPRLAETPEELTAANVTSSTFDSVGAFAGPAAGALLYALGGPTARVPVRLADLPLERVVRRAHPEDRAAGAGAARARGRRRDRRRLPRRAGRAAPARRDRALRAQTLVAGAYSVLVVVVALELLDLGNAGVGFLQAATGVGAIIGAIVALALVGRRRTAADFGLGLACFGAPLLALAALPRTWAAIVALALLGIGNSVVDISAVTLIQRTASAAVAGRVFGLVEAAAVGGLGIGSVLTPLLLHLAGARWTLAVAGAILPMLVARDAPRARQRSTRARPCPEEQLAAIATVPFLDVLPIQRKEALAAALERIERPAGATFFSAGDHGDRLYILTPGDDRDRPAERAEDRRARPRSSVRSPCCATSRAPRRCASSPTRRSGRSTATHFLDAVGRAQPQPEGGRRARRLARNRAQRLNKPPFAL